MKTPILKPGFEFIFALSLLAILGLPPMLMAQDQKDVEIKIVNGDTTVNGKNIKDLSLVERKEAMRDIRHLSADDMTNNDGGKRHMFVYKQRDSIRTDGHDFRGITGAVITRDDSIRNMKMMKRDQMMRNMPPGSMDNTPDGMTWKGRTGRGPMREPMMGFASRNSQNFSYVTTDNEGISTRVTYHVADVTNDDLKRMPHVEGARLEVTDLSIVPQFTTGKTLLIFSLPGKGSAEVKLVDSDGKVLWTERSTGETFSKSFALGLNGVYYLQVKQGNGVAVKRIMKEE